MNYGRIYEQFIANRRANQPGKAEYSEVHHITPKCMGGSDDPDNLIRLRPGDHFFAHLCLAKAYRTPKLWASVFVMLNLRHVRASRRKGYAMVRGRRDYQWLILRKPRGLDAMGADRTIYHFRHKDGREMHCTRVEFGQKTGASPQDIANMLSGRNKSARGWHMPALNPSGIIGREAASRGRAHKTIYHFRHKDGREMQCTKRDFARATGMQNSTIARLLNGELLLSQGWFLPSKNPAGEDKGTRHTGLRNPAADRTIYYFKHDDGREERATRIEMTAKHGGNAVGWWQAIHKGCACRGWRLQGSAGE